MPELGRKLRDLWRYETAQFEPRKETEYSSKDLADLDDRTGREAWGIVQLVALLLASTAPSGQNKYLIGAASVIIAGELAKYYLHRRNINYQIPA